MYTLHAVEIALLLLAFAGIAALYSSVGHGGATGYLAMMALLGIAPVLARPGALWMNCFVATLAYLRFRRAGYFDRGLFSRLAITSIPMAWWGSRLELEAGVHASVVAVALAGAGSLLFRGGHSWFNREVRPAPVGLTLLVGAALGMMAGLTGIGGGVFLTPLLLLFGWSSTRSAGGVSALFILVNSAAGLIGLGERALVGDPLLLAGPPVAVLGAIGGTRLGVHRWSIPAFQRALAVVLWIAALKLVFSGT